MRRLTTHHPAAWLATGGYVALLGIGGHLDSPLAWRGAFAGIVALAFVAWLITLRRLRAITGMPTSRIASAAQGYTELVGRGQPDLPPLFSPLNGVPCLWYAYRVEEKSGDQWVTRQCDESIASFWIDDGSGRCLVHPSGAEILAANQRTWQEGDYRYQQSLIQEGEQVYVLGEFRTYGGSQLELDARRDVSELLSEWKADQKTLLQRFDRNGDGQIDLAEWEVARTEARREIEKQHGVLRSSTPETATIGQTTDGRLFLLSTLPEKKIGLRYRLWCCAHLAAFFGGIVAEHQLWLSQAALP